MVKGSDDVAGSTSRGLDVTNKSFDKRVRKMDDKAMSTTMYVWLAGVRKLSGTS